MVHLTDKQATWSSQWLFVPYLGIALLIFVYVIQFTDDVNEKLQRQNALAVMRLEQAQARDAWARYDTALGGCQRGNIVRQQIDDLRDGVVQLNVILATFMDRNAALLELAERDASARQALQARNRIAEIAADLPQVEQNDCDLIVPKPFVPRPAAQSPTTP